jgi:hypothetical protein
VVDDALPRLQDVVRLPSAPHVVLSIVLLLCFYQFKLFPGECAKCAVIERHLHMEGHLGNPAEPRVDTTLSPKASPGVAAELLRWPRHDTLPPPLSVVKVNQVKRPRDSHDDLDLATEVRLLCNDVEAIAGCEHSAVCAAHATLVVACAPRRHVGHGRAHARRLFSSMS